MIKLIDILKEITEGKQVGLLYHWTDLKSLISIIKDNTLNATNPDYGKTTHAYIDGPSVSFTRVADKNTFQLAEEADAVLVIDGDKLSNNYKIIPYSDFNAFSDEMEERIYNKNIINLDKYIIKVILYKSTSNIESLLKEKNIPYEIK
jgi:hypothetical protein